MVKHNQEFALHVHKKIATERHPDLYTIGIWAGSTLHAICQTLGHSRSASSWANSGEIYRDTGILVGDPSELPMVVMALPTGASSTSTSLTADCSAMVYPPSQPEDHLLVQTLPSR